MPTMVFGHYKQALITLDFAERNWGERRGLNPRQPESQSGTLPAELQPPSKLEARAIMARPAGLEPTTPGLEGRCSIRLSYGHSLGEGTQILVGVERFELPTSWSQTRRATRLRYTPKAA